jgi:PKD repeat protein
LGGEHFYVLADGRKVRLTQSETEYGVTLHRCDDAQACAARLAARGLGALKHLEHAPAARVKLLEVSKTAAAKRVDILGDAAIESVAPVYRFESSDTPVLGTGTAVVKLRPQVSDTERAAIWREHDVAMATPLPGQPRVYLITPRRADEEVDLAERLAADPRVRWAQPNLRRSFQPQQVVPFDPYYGLQWHLNNTGQLGGRVDADVDAVEAWSITTGEGVLFGIFDDGCDVDHEDLRQNYIGFGQDATVAPNVEGSDDPRPKVLGDFHATPVIGLAVASGNSLGGRGIAYGGKFTASRGLTELSELELTDVEFARAFNFARENNVDVHINSYAGRNFPDPEVVVDVIDLAFREGRNRGDLDGDGNDDPLGMVMVFASGNDGIEVRPGFGFAVLPQVIGVGGSDDQDGLYCRSNFGSGIDFLAPTFGCALESAGVLTTDNTDGDEVVDPGFNDGGNHIGTTVPEVDPQGKYTKFFGGTSAACPIAAGVAGLILSVNPLLTATDVRLLLEHTADRIDVDVADYHGITSRSLTHGYGRINAGGAGDDKLGAVEAAQQTLNNGGVTWPERPADVRVEGIFLRWRHNYGSEEFLVLSANEPFDFIPQNGACYSSDQGNCAEVVNLPGGVSVLAVGCGLSCDPESTAICAIGAEQCAKFTTPGAGQTKFFAIYARNALGRYSFGVAADSTGEVIDSGTVVGEDGGGGSGSEPPPPAGPAVTISVSPLEGLSPLTVRFAGNAVSPLPIDESRTIWDFNTEDGIPVDATTRTATHTYIVPARLTKTFIARLTMYDSDGNAGYSEVGVRVEGPADEDDPPDTSSADVRIVIGVPGSAGSDVDTGVSPFAVSLSVDASDLPGTLQSVSWDLGDGTRATGLTVPHTYVNSTDVALRLPITAMVTTVTSGGTVTNSSTTRMITINPGLDVVDPGDPDLPGTDPHGEGGAATPCQGIGMIPMLLMVLGMGLLRRRA